MSQLNAPTLHDVNATCFGIPIPSSGSTYQS